MRLREENKRRPGLSDSSMADRGKEEAVWTLLQTNGEAHETHSRSSTKPTNGTPARMESFDLDRRTKDGLFVHVATYGLGVVALRGAAVSGVVAGKGGNCPLFPKFWAVGKLSGNFSSCRKFFV